TDRGSLHYQCRSKYSHCPCRWNSKGRDCKWQQLTACQPLITQARIIPASLHPCWTSLRQRFQSGPTRTLVLLKSCFWNLWPENLTCSPTMEIALWEKRTSVLQPSLAL